MKINPKYCKKLSDGKLPVIHVNNLEEALFLSREFNRLGLEWCSGEKYNDEDTTRKFVEYGDKLCFSPSKGNYTQRTYFEQFINIYKIFEFRKILYIKKFVEVEE